MHDESCDGMPIYKGWFQYLKTADLCPFLYLPSNIALVKTGIVPNKQSGLYQKDIGIVANVITYR